jgi:hypothetical protein
VEPLQCRAIEVSTVSRARRYVSSPLVKRWNK